MDDEALNEAIAEVFKLSDTSLYWIGYDLRSDHSADLIGRLEELEATHILKSDWLLDTHEDLIFSLSKSTEALRVLRRFQARCANHSATRKFPFY